MNGRMSGRDEMRRGPRHRVGQAPDGTRTLWLEGSWGPQFEEVWDEFDCRALSWVMGSASRARPSERVVATMESVEVKARTEHEVGWFRQAPLRAAYLGGGRHRTPFIGRLPDSLEYLGLERCDGRELKAPATLISCYGAEAHPSSEIFAKDRVPHLRSLRVHDLPELVDLPDDGHWRRLKFLWVDNSIVSGFSAALSAPDLTRLELVLPEGSDPIDLGNLDGRKLQAVTLSSTEPIAHLGKLIDLPAARFIAVDAPIPPADEQALRDHGFESDGAGRWNWSTLSGVDEWDWSMD